MTFSDKSFSSIYCITEESHAPGSIHIEWIDIACACFRSERVICDGCRELNRYTQEGYELTSGAVEMLTAVVVGEGRLYIEGTALIPSNRFSLCARSGWLEQILNITILWLTGCTGMTSICLSQYQPSTYSRLASDKCLLIRCLDLPLKPVASGPVTHQPPRNAKQQETALVSFLML